MDFKVTQNVFHTEATLQEIMHKPRQNGPMGDHFTPATLECVGHSDP
jgi:hypothetical protein